MQKAMFLFVLVACGTDVQPDDEPSDGGGTDGYAPLITSSWQLPPSTEKYLCVRKTLTADTWIKSLRPIAPLGTHHAVLMLGAPDAADGTVECNSGLPKPGIYASGVGTNVLELPAGVAVHAKAGDQLLLNLHLFNAGTDPLSGTSGVEFTTTDPASVVHEAGVVLVGKATGLYVDTGMTTQTGTCTTPAGTTLFAVAPHMHLLGTHMKATYGSQVLYDEDYTFDGQHFQMIDPMISTVANGTYTVTCSYYNPGAPVTFGESTTDEMCYALTYVYPPPKVNSCTN